MGVGVVVCVLGEWGVGGGGLGSWGGGGGDFTSKPLVPKQRICEYVYFHVCFHVCFHVNMIFASLVSPYEACFRCERKGIFDNGN